MSWHSQTLNVGEHPQPLLCLRCATVGSQEHGHCGQQLPRVLHQVTHMSCTAVVFAFCLPLCIAVVAGCAAGSDYLCRLGMLRCCVSRCS